MSKANPAGKGTDRRRYDLAAWDAGYRRIFGSKKKAGCAKTAKNRQRRKELPR